MVRMLSVVMGEEIPPEYGPMLAEEAAISTDPRVEEPVDGRRRASAC